MAHVARISFISLGTLGALLTLLLSLFATSPGGLGPTGVTIWFIVLLLAFTGLLTVGLYAVKSYLKLHGTGDQRLRFSLRQGFLLGLWGTVMLALSSLRQWSLRDALLFALILIVVEIYIRLRQA
jgi:hypothetical protein